MSSSSMCQTVYDTVHTVIYDTVHTSVFDTVHTVSYDTVRVVLDSSFTPQLLRDSQEFYSWAFMAIVAVIGLGSGILAFVLNRLWDRKVNIEVDKLKNDCKKDSEEVVSKALEKAKIEFSGVAEKEAKSIKRESNDLWNSTFFALLASTRNDRNDLYVIDSLCRLLENSIGRIDEKLCRLIMNDLIPELDKRIDSLELAENFDSFIMASQENLNHFASVITSLPLGENEKNTIAERIKKINGAINSKLDKYYKMKKGEASENRNRMQVRKNRF